jgi:hypothetical protein
MLARALLLSLLVSAPAQASVALVVSIPDEDAVHREFASGLVADAYQRWEMLSPQLDPGVVTDCKSDDKCLLREATSREASHLLVVRVAALGPAEFVVSVRLLDESGGQVIDASDLAAPGADPRAAGRGLGEKLFASVAGLAPAPPGQNEAIPPAPAEGATAAPAAAAAYDGLSPVTLAGFGVVGATLVAVAGVGVWGLLATTSGEGRTVEDAATIAAATAAVGVATGFSLIAVDQALLH